MKINIPKILYLVLIIGIIVIGIVLFMQSKLPAQKPITISPPTSNEIQTTTQPITQIATSTQGQMDTTSSENQEIKVMSPIKGDKWKIGETYQIRWEPSDPKTRVVIRLYKVPILSLNLVWEASEPVPNSGIYSFSVYQGMQPGDYQFIISAGGEKKGESEIFSIVE